MRTIHYDFTPFNDIFARMICMGKASNHDLNELKKECNKFFDAKCDNVYYTENTDKMFFGMKLIAKIDNDKVYDYITDQTPLSKDDLRIWNYSLELDSKLFNPLLNLQPEELTAMLLHEVGHMVNDTTPLQNARDHINSYLFDNKETLSMTDSIHYKEILAYGIKDFISKDRSMFYTVNEDEILADEFVRGCGYSEYLGRAFNKIMKNNTKLYVDSDISKFTAMAWTLRLYKGLRFRRVGALRTIAKAKQATASVLEKKELENMTRRIRSIDDSQLLESAQDKVKARMRKMRYDSIRSLDDDYYEIAMRIRNVEDEDDALYLMRQINTRLGIMEDYLNSEDIDDKERKKWFESIDRFKELREKLSKTVTYKSKTYGIYVNYPDIRADNY